MFGPEVDLWHLLRIIVLRSGLEIELSNFNSRFSLLCLYFTLGYYASFRFETWSEEILLHLFCDLPTDYQIVCVRNFIHLFENVRNFVRNCPKFVIISSENLCPKIKCPKIKRPKILEINVNLSK